VIGVFVAQYRAFAEVRNQRDVARAEIQERFNAVKFRLVFDHSLMSLRLRRDDQEPGVHVGFTLRNVSTEPLRFAVQSMNVVLDGRSHPHPTFDTDGTVLAPDQGYVFWFPWFDGLEVRRGMRGTMNYVIHYGHAEDQLRFRLEHRQELTCVRTREDGEWRVEVRDLMAPTVDRL
jgi:hypothetical protein